MNRTTRWDMGTLSKIEAIEDEHFRLTFSGYIYGGTVSVATTPIISTLDLCTSGLGWLYGAMLDRQTLYVETVAVYRNGALDSEVRTITREEPVLNERGETAVRKQR